MHQSPRLIERRRGHGAAVSCSLRQYCGDHDGAGRLLHDTSQRRLSMSAVAYQDSAAGGECCHDFLCFVKSSDDVVWTHHPADHQRHRPQWEGHVTTYVESDVHLERRASAFDSLDRNAFY